MKETERLSHMKPDEEDGNPAKCVRLTWVLEKNERHLGDDWKILN